jgi:hypothetical protein
MSHYLGLNIFIGNGMVWYALELTMVWYALEMEMVCIGMVSISLPLPCMVCIGNGMVGYGMHWKWYGTH